MRKYHYFIYPWFIFYYIQIISFYLFPVYDFFVDYGYYFTASLRFWNNGILYQNNFVYLPSFFILTPFLFSFNIYFVFLMISLIISLIILLKLKEDYGTVVFFMFLAFLYIYNGNIDPFILMLVLISIYYEKDQYLPPILLAFISFKPTVIFIIPYFLYISKNRVKFIFLYGSFLLLINSYLVIHIDVLAEFFNYSFGEWQTTHYMDYIRPYWIYIVYYFGLKKEYKKKIILKEFE